MPRGPGHYQKRGRPPEKPEHLAPTRVKPMKGPGSRRRGPQTIPVEERAAVTTLPTSPCFRCGARGACRHRGL